MIKKSNQADRIGKFCAGMLAKYPRAIEQEKTFLDAHQSGELEWPDWCTLPMSATASMVMAAFGSPEDIAQLAAALLWRKAKIIYDFDTTLAEELARQPLNGKIPIEILFRMPYPCVYLSIGSSGFFAWLEWDVNSQVPELRILSLKSDGSTVSIPIILSGTIEDSAKSLIQSGKSRAKDFLGLDITPDEDSFAEDFRSVAAAINLILYVCAENADMPDDPIIREHRSYDRDGLAKRPATVPVGARIGSALRQERRAPISEMINARHAHASPVPHVRRAHWHHFWAGKRSDDSRKLILHWLPPTAVAMQDNPDLQATIHPVKPDEKEKED